MLRKEVAEFIVDRSSTFEVSHGWGTKDVIVQTFDADTGELIEMDVLVPDDATVRLTMGNSGGLRAFRAVVIG